MRMTTVSDTEDQLAFAKKAADYFATHPGKYSFGAIEPGEYLALRWGGGDDCVLVLKQDDFFQPVNYTRIIEVAT